MQLSAAFVTIGLDVGNRHSVFCAINENGAVIDEGRVATSKKALTAWFSRLERARIALEACSDSPWISDLLEDLGHEVLVANPRAVALITKSDRKNDRNDARLLARIARADPTLLSPIKHRATELRADLAVIRARDELVEARTKLINCARGLVKSSGARLPKCSSESFPKKAVPEVPTVMHPAVDELLAVVDRVTASIKHYDVLIEELAETKYPEVSLLTAVSGVGTLTALAFVLTVGHRDRFTKSRHVGAYFGLVPRQQQSSSVDPQLRITKAGDALVRRLLVSAAHYILGHFGPDTDLRRWGLAIAERGGKNGKKRAVVAVARKLAVLLHRLWRTGEVYEPLRATKRKSAAKPSVENVTASAPNRTRKSSRTPATKKSGSGGELRGQATRVETPQKRPRKGGRVSHTLPDHDLPTRSNGALRRSAAPRSPAAAK